MPILNELFIFVSLFNILINIKMRTIITSFVFFIAFTVISAQSYNTAIGLRLGYPAAISGKKFINENTAIEGMLGFRSYVWVTSLNLTALYQKHYALGDVENLTWYWGLGANVALNSYRSTYLGEQSGALGLGVAGGLGVDYKFEDLPLNVSLDWTPIIPLVGYRYGWNFNYYALTGRYVLN